MDGTASLYALSRQDLQRWYHVEGLSPQLLQQRYRKETGVYADRDNLVRWLKAPEQAVSILDENTDIHSHACGEYVLEQLQSGVSAAEVVKQLLPKYLVRATTQRVLAYCRYREETGDYWSVEQLARLHWEHLYAEVSLEWQLGVASRSMGPSRSEAQCSIVVATRLSLRTQLRIS